MGKITAPGLKEMKARGQKITMLTAYDFSFARIIDEAGVDIILVGDSLGMVVLGYENTLPVTFEEMLHHTQAVTRASKNSMVVADMPFLSYQVSREEGLRNAGRFIKEGNADAVKIEGGEDFAGIIKSIVKIGIPVMGHLGLTPQFIHQFGGYKIQGKEEEQAERILLDARILQDSGIFSLVLECVPASLAKRVSEALDIPVIGIGAGPHCDGQVQVLHDILGLFTEFVPKHAKQYVNLYPLIKEAVIKYAGDVKEERFLR